MKKNMGKADSYIRLLVSIILVTLYFTETLTGAWGIVALVVAGIFLLTSILGFCPLYTLLGIRTCKKN
ncbi:MAG TPA: DUF2892 domain-containing protein [Prolixibacteraceae bacterium]|nr:DUF2892 domain-containing protein [Prolixibacteraceae bacterium]